MTLAEIYEYAKGYGESLMSVYLDEYTHMRHVTGKAATAAITDHISPYGDWTCYSPWEQLAAGINHREDAETGWERYEKAFWVGVRTEARRRGLHRLARDLRDL